MSSASPYPSQGSHLASQRQKKRRWTREELLKSLELLNSLGTPLPSTLPPSPPPSRAASPAHAPKRKLDDDVSDIESSKRPRISSVAARQSVPQSTPSLQTQPRPSQARSSAQHHHPTPSSSSSSSSIRAPDLNPPSGSRSEPCEDGEVREEPVPPVPRGPPVDLPIARPKFPKPDADRFEALFNKYHHQGRLFKYSGSARLWASYPPNHPDYKALEKLPATNSPYHTHASLIARLELLDALVCFTYSIWNKDYARNMCMNETWDTVIKYLDWCRVKWAQARFNDAEAALVAIIPLLEGTIYMREVYFNQQRLDRPVEKAFASIKAKHDAAVTSGELQNGSPVKDGKTPPMLPSPNSANSTPVNRDDATPNNTTSRPPGPVPIPPTANPAALPHGQHLPHVARAIANLTEPLSYDLMSNIHTTKKNTLNAAKAIRQSQKHLNLPTLRRCFPQTWARIAYSNLSPEDEYIPDLEDNEGELYWPDQAVYGDGLGWICLMARAMIMEYGKNFGYKGVDGLIPKPKPEEAVVNPNHSRPRHPQRQGPPPGHGPPPRHVGAPR